MKRNLEVEAPIRTSVIVPSGLISKLINRPTNIDSGISRNVCFARPAPRGDHSSSVIK
jgi:hypothetical protein